jgi:chromate transporter
VNPFTFFLTVLKSSALSTGGFGNVPILHGDLVPTHIVSGEQFAESLAIGQISPGPNGLWVICLGYFVGGTLDAALALVAIALPPLLILVVRKIYEKHRHNRGVEGFMMGLEIAVVAIFFSVMIDFLAGAERTLFTPVVAVAAFVLSLANKVPVAAIIVVSAVAAWCLSVTVGPNFGLRL